MKGIDLSAKSLTRNIPSEIGLLMLSLSHNHLSGEILITITEMSVLESLDLSFNNLGGKIPTAITFFSMVNLIDFLN